MMCFNLPALPPPFREGAGQVEKAISEIIFFAYVPMLAGQVALARLEG